MARAQASDFLHSMRYHVKTSTPAVATLSPGNRAEAGFSMVTTPEATVEVVEYKEGTMIYRRKYPGNPNMNDITMSRGVARGDSSFWDWLRRTIEGSGEYRTDLDIDHYHREQALNRDYPTTGADANLTNINLDSPARVYHVKEAFPARHKVAGDLDASASEISIMELDISYEYFEVEEKS